MDAVVRPSYLSFYDLVRDFGADPAGVVNCQTALQAAVDNVLVKDLYLPAGTFLYDYIVITRAINIHTAGFQTILKRTTTSVFNHPQIIVSCDNVSIIGDISFVGNIALDTGEYNHCIALQNAGSGSIKNFSCGTINATNIRGDALYVGGTPTCNVNDVTVRGIQFVNLLRSGCSVVGGENIQIGFIDGYQNGYRSLDVEPNGASNQTCDGIQVGYIRGGRVQFAGSAANAIGTVRIGQCRLDGTLNVNSSPAYASYDSTAPLVQGQNLALAYIEDLAVSNCTFVPCFFGSGSVKGLVRVDRYKSTGTGTSETTYKSQFICDGIAELWLGSGGIASFAVDRAIAKGLSSNRYNFGYLGQLATTGTVVAGGSNSHFRNVTSASAGDYPYQSLTDCVLEECTVTACASIFYACTKVRAVGGNFTYTTSTDASGSTKLFFQRATVQTVWYDHWALDTGYTEAIRLGSNWLWVDPATNKVYVQATAPTTNTSGTIVGTQT